MATLYKSRIKRSEPFLTFSSPDFCAISYDTKNYNGTLEFSQDKKTWVEFSPKTIVDNSYNGEIYLRGSNNTHLAADDFAPTNFKLQGTNVSCSGNIETLLDWETVANGEHPAMDRYCFTYLFYGCTSLISAPELPATTLSNYCYMNMFQGCTSLTNPPALPATTLKMSCYTQMFKSCTSLISAPELPATTLASGCYMDMFYKCTSLVNVPALPATTLISSCYNGMFYGCTSLKFSETQTSEYKNAYSFGAVPSGSYANNMFTNTGGTFTGIPTKATYYTANEIVA